MLLQTHGQAASQNLVTIGSKQRFSCAVQTTNYYFQFFQSYSNLVRIHLKQTYRIYKAAGFLHAICPSCILTTALNERVNQDLINVNKTKTVISQTSWNGQLCYQYHGTRSAIKLFGDFQGRGLNSGETWRTRAYNGSLRAEPQRVHGQTPFSQVLQKQEKTWRSEIFHILDSLSTGILIASSKCS